MKQLYFLQSSTAVIFRIFFVLILSFPKEIRKFLYSSQRTQKSVSLPLWKGWGLGNLFLLLGTINSFSQTAVNDYYSTHIENSIAVNPLNNDPGCWAYNMVITTPPLHGTLSAINADGSFTYTPNTGFTGRDSLCYSVTCNNNSSFAWVYFIITSLPDNLRNINCAEEISAYGWYPNKKDSSTYTTLFATQPLVGDIDNDGQNEIIELAKINDSTPPSIIIYDHLSRVKTTFPTLVTDLYENGPCPIAIADVDNDRISEIFAYSKNGILTCYNYDGNNVIVKWNINMPSSSYASSPILSDINADGISEILVMNRIYNARTGELEIIIPSLVDIYSKHSMPVFADMDNDGLLEVVENNKVIKVSITNPHGTIGNSAYIWKTITGIDIEDGYTSVADIDLDGYMDVVVNTKNNCLYVWKPHTGQNSVPILLGKIFSSDPYPDKRSRVIIHSWSSYYPKIIWSSFSNIQAYSWGYGSTGPGLYLAWRHPIAGTSGPASISVYDGMLIYQDGSHLKVLRSNDGMDVSRYSSLFYCPSTSCLKYPVIVDLNRDGSTKIVASSYDNNGKCVINSFETPSWYTARPIWNQYSYNIVHVNEDLTIPQYQFNPLTAFPNGLLRIRIFNNFLEQAKIEDQRTIPVRPLTDITPIEDSIEISNFCDSIQINFTIQNQGNCRLNAPFEITTYKNQYRGNIIRTDTIRQSIDTNSLATIFLTFTSADFTGFLPITDLVFAINDTGTGIAQNGGQQPECDTNNNIFAIPFQAISSYRTQFTASICQKEPFIGYDFNLPSDSTATVGVFHFYQYLTSIQGCDSIVDLELTVHPAYVTEINVKMCNSYEIGDTTYTESGNYISTLNTINGCDSVIDLSLIIFEKYDIEISATACESYQWNEQVYTTSGNYIQHFTSTQGCDSVVNLTLTIFPNSSIFVEDTIFVGETYNKHSFNIPKQEMVGIYKFQQKLQNQWGCDSVVNLNLHVVWPVIDHSSDLDFPNGFMPYGNSNNYFCVGRKRNIKDLKIQIYNRWGDLVYQSSDINFKWDGKDLKGTLVPVGTYVYWVEYHSLADPNITKQKTGNINVVY